MLISSLKPAVLMVESYRVSKINGAVDVRFCRHTALISIYFCKALYGQSLHKEMVCMSSRYARLWVSARGHLGVANTQAHRIDLWGVTV